MRARHSSVAIEPILVRSLISVKIFNFLRIRVYNQWISTSNIGLYVVQCRKFNPYLCDTNEFERFPNIFGHWQDYFNTLVSLFVMCAALYWQMDELYVNLSDIRTHIGCLCVSPANWIFLAPSDIISVTALNQQQQQPNRQHANKTNRYYGKSTFMSFDELSDLLSLLLCWRSLSLYIVVGVNVFIAMTRFYCSFHITKFWSLQTIPLKPVHTHTNW